MVLLQTIEALEQRVARLEAAFEEIEEPEWDVAIKNARQYFQASHREKVYPTELADYLGTSVSQAVDICAALEKEGVIVEQ